MASLGSLRLQGGFSKEWNHNSLCRAKDGTQDMPPPQEGCKEDGVARREQATDGHGVIPSVESHHLQDTRDTEMKTSPDLGEKQTAKGEKPRMGIGLQRNKVPPAPPSWSASYSCVTCAVLG